MRTAINPGWDHFERYSFSPAVVTDGWLFVSGLTGIEPGAPPGTIVQQLDIIFRRLREVLQSAGCEFTDVVRTREYITTTDGYRETDHVRRRYFQKPFPAATGVIVAGLLRPGAVIELDADARVPGVT